MPASLRGNVVVRSHGGGARFGGSAGPLRAAGVVEREEGGEGKGRGRWGVLGRRKGGGSGSSQDEGEVDVVVSVLI